MGVGIGDDGGKRLCTCGPMMIEHHDEQCMINSPHSNQKIRM